MASLTQVAITTRKTIRYGIIGVFALIALRILIGVGIRAYRYFFPPPPPPPTVAFGRLPSINFPESEGENLSFVLETPEGGLPTLPTQANVYFMPKLSPNLLSLEAATVKAIDLGFTGEPQEVSQTIYRFPHGDAPATLEVNIITGIFSISYDLANDSSPIERIPPSPEVAAAQVRSYLSSADLLPEDLIGPTSHTFLKIEDGQLVTALGQSDADLVKVNLFRKDYEAFPSMPSDPDQANIWFMVSGARTREKQFIAAEYHYFPIDEAQGATYPLKTAEDAWSELQAGQSFIAGGGNQEGPIVIRRVYLGYYDPDAPEEFFQPIVVFEGDGGFFGYVPAISPEYYGE